MRALRLHVRAPVRLRVGPVIVGIRRAGATTAAAKHRMMTWPIVVLQPVKHGRARRFLFLRRSRATTIDLRTWPGRRRPRRRWLVG